MNTCDPQPQAVNFLYECLSTFVTCQCFDIWCCLSTLFNFKFVIVLILVCFWLQVSVIIWHLMLVSVLTLHICLHFDTRCLSSFWCLVHVVLAVDVSVLTSHNVCRHFDTRCLSFWCWYLRVFNSTQCLFPFWHLVFVILIVMFTSV